MKKRYLSTKRYRIAIAQSTVQKISDANPTVNPKTIAKIMSLQVYGIPSCGTCKKALNWLNTNGIAYEFINTKDQPPDRATIAYWVSTLSAKPMRNTSGQSYRSLGEAKQTWTDEQWVEAFAQDAMLLKRPLFVSAGTAIAVGFKEDAIRQTLIEVGAIVPDKS
jgi:arsenate reductase (glutaredoxin)